MERKQLKNLNESIDSVFLKENVYSLLGVPADFDRNNKEHANLLKKNYRALSVALHPDRNKDYPNAGKLFSHVTSAYDFLNSGSTTTPNELFVGQSHERPLNVSSRIRLTRSDLDTILNTAHGGEHWKPKEGKALNSKTALDHVLSWEEEQKKHHGKINDALVSIYNPTSGERRGTRQRSSSTETQSPPPPPPSRKQTVMDRPPVRGNDPHSEFLHYALGRADTFLDPSHIGNTENRSNIQHEAFTTTNPLLGHLHHSTFSRGPTHGFVVRTPHQSEGVVSGYNVEPEDQRHKVNFSHDTHHLSMILDPAYAQRAIADAHSSHRNFREAFKQQHGREAGDQDIHDAIQAGTIRGVGLPAEEEEQKLVQRHIHGLQMAAIHHPNVHANDLVAILQRRPSTHSDTESDPYGPRGRTYYAAGMQPKTQEDKNLQELQVAAISKLLHPHNNSGFFHTGQTQGQSNFRTNLSSAQFITSATQRAANLWDQHRKDINAKPDGVEYLGANDPITPHHINRFLMHPQNHKANFALFTAKHSFGDELERLKKQESAEREGHALLGIHHPDALVRQTARAHLDRA